MIRWRRSHGEDQAWILQTTSTMVSMRIAGDSTAKNRYPPAPPLPSLLDPFALYISFLFPSSTRGAHQLEQLQSETKVLSYSNLLSPSPPLLPSPLLLPPSLLLRYHLSISINGSLQSNLVFEGTTAEKNLTPSHPHPPSPLFFCSILVLTSSAVTNETRTVDAE